MPAADGRSVTAKVQRQVGNQAVAHLVGMGGAALLNRVGLDRIGGGGRLSVNVQVCAARTRRWPPSPGRHLADRRFPQVIAPSHVKASSTPD